MQVVGVRVTSYDKKFTHFNYFGASCRYAGEWTVIHLSVHICFLASTFNAATLPTKFLHYHSSNALECL